MNRLFSFPSIVVLTFAGLSLTARPAAADIVPNPPPDCLDGTAGATCHGGPYCAPDGCATDADCDGGDVCKDTPLCTATIDCGGNGGPAPTTEVTGPCDAACSSCTTLKVCVAPSSSTTTGSSGAGAGGGSGAAGAGGDGTEYVVTGCGCDLSGRGTAFGAAGALLLAAGLAGRRRRRD